METMNLKVSQALDDFYRLNNFGEDGGVNKNIIWIKFGLFSIPIPNTESRKKAITLHDIGHLITENNTDWKGECAVSAWEIGSGGWRDLVFPWLLTLWAMGLGVVIYPRIVFDSFKKGLTMRNPLTCDITKDDLLKMSISELRQKLSNHTSINKNPYFWMSLSFMVFAFPFIGIIGTIYLAFTF